MIHTGAEFERLSWHDCYIWGVEFAVGDAAADDWTSDLILDIDFIVEWVRGSGGVVQFRVAPATLAFHGVTDPHISIDWGSSGFQTSLHGVSIDRIERDRVTNQKVFLDRPYYSWRIILNWPKSGFITFGAVDFTQTQLAEPMLIERQHLTLRERRARVKKSDVWHW